MKKTHIALATLLLTLGTSAFAQQPVRTEESAPKLWRSSFGVSGGVDRSIESPNFRYLPGYPGCNPNSYESGSGTAPNASVYWKYTPSDTWFFSAGLGYTKDNATLSVDEQTAIALDGIATPATISHSIDATLDRFTFAPALGYQVIPKLGVIVGGELGFMRSPTFSSREQLKNPYDRAVFEENGSRTRNAQSGTLPNANALQSALTFGARYTLPMNALGSLALVPSLHYRVGLTSFVQGLAWRENGLGGALAIEYTPVDYPEPLKPEPKPEAPKLDTLPAPPKPPALLASVTAAGVDTNGVEMPEVVKLRIEELYEVSKVPLIPYVFFANRSDSLDSRYLTIEEHEAAQLENKPGTDRLTLYTDVLNLIGERMQQHPAAKLTLTGCADPSEKPHDVALSQKRAETVRDYLATKWNVDPKRIAVRSRELPDHPSPVQDTDGEAENRRVEIAATDGDILAPVSVGDTLRPATPPIVRFRPSVTAEAGIDNWVIEAEQQQKLLARFSGRGEVPPKVDWIVANDQSTVPRAPGTLEYRLRVRDTKNQLREAKGEMNVEQYTLRTKKKLYADDGKAEIENYSLVLFDFNSSDLSSENRSVLAEIKSQLKPTSQVTITGYTDRIGEPAVNQALAMDRARRVADALNLPESICRSATGTYPYSNENPEGRFYSRTVSISIRNPVGPGE